VAFSAAVGAMSVDCYATPDRHEPGMMSCLVCRLFWEITDPHPPWCRARASAEAQPLMKAVVTCRP
jgi:hypothetical protein